jgi:hypothetical protein
MERSINAPSKFLTTEFIATSARSMAIQASPGRKLYQTQQCCFAVLSIEPHQTILSLFDQTHQASEASK